MLTLLLIALAVAPPVVLPDESAPRSPGQVRVLAESPVIPSANFSDAKNCGSCHADIAAQWRTSAHALASFTNPLYRISIEKLRVDRGEAASRMCGACHDLALLTSGALDEKVIAADDPRAHAGVSCTTCHSAVHATRDGNGSLTLRADEVFPSLPAESTLERHRARVASTTLRTAELCGTCHRSFLEEKTGNEAAFFGMDDYGAWLRSAYAGSAAERPDHVRGQDCRACHMEREPAVLGDVAAKNGTVPSHRFLGAHTTLAAMRGDQAQLARVQRFLEKAATVDVAAAKVNGAAWTMPAEAAAVKAGDTVEVDVVVFNERAGHRFPGGVLDNQGTRLEVALRTAHGQLLALSDEHELRAQVVSKDGRPVQRRETHEFLAAVWNHTVPSRDARVTRIRAMVPGELPASAFPLVVEAKLTHRARSEELMIAACEELKTPRGREFQEAGFRQAGQRLDPCVPQPVTIVDRAEAALSGAKTRGAWLRAYRHGLGLSVGLQEYLDEARAAFEHAQTLAKGEEVGVTRWALGSLAGRRGQLPQALEHLAAAEAQLGRTPAILKARGDAYAQVWRWRSAAQAFTEAARLAPRDVVLWQSVAMAQASSGRYAEALFAAQRGLELQPRDGDCLRVQALALAALGQPADEALDVALKWRTPDDAPRARALCSAKVPGCANRRNPVPLFDARAP